MEENDSFKIVAGSFSTSDYASERNFSTSASLPSR
jgi:hypothetical protein